jgi:hypothetical protein
MTALEPFDFDKLIGNTVDYQGLRYLVVDYLLKDQSLVLRSLNAEASIQVNQFGSANRRVQPTLTLSVFTAHSELQPEVLEWFAQC